jgi:hypothetical protein
MNCAAVCPHEFRLAPIQPSTKLVLGVKRPAREAGHLPSVKVKNELKFTSTPHMHYGVKSDDGFTFSLFWTLCIFSLKKETVSFCETFAISPYDSAQSSSQDSRFHIRKHLVFKDMAPFLFASTIGSSTPAFPFAWNLIGYCIVVE